jgi:hypothetical protein
MLAALAPIPAQALVEYGGTNVVKEMFGAITRFASDNVLWLVVGAVVLMVLFRYLRE